MDQGQVATIAPALEFWLFSVRSGQNMTSTFYEAWEVEDEGTLWAVMALLLTWKSSPRKLFPISWPLLSLEAMMLSLFRVIRLIVTGIPSAMQLWFMNCGLPQSGVSIHLLFLLMCSPGHILLKMTSLTLTSASFFHGLRGNRLMVSWARRLEMLYFLDCNNEGNSVQKSNLDFWHELPVQMHRIYCHMTAKCDRFLSDPGQIQVRLKGHCLPTWISSPLPTSRGLDTGKMVTALSLCPPLG